MKITLCRSCKEPLVAVENPRLIGVMECTNTECKATKALSLERGQQATLRCKDCGDFRFLAKQGHFDRSDFDCSDCDNQITLPALMPRTEVSAQLRIGTAPA